MSPFDRVEKDFGGFLYAFEEGVVFGRAGCGAFVGVMTEDFFAMSRLDLGFSSAIAVAGETEDSVMILTLGRECMSLDIQERRRGEG